MHLADSDNAQEQFGRIYKITGARTQVELAEILGIRQSSIADAKKRGKVPPQWLVKLARYLGVHPEWVITGTGPSLISAQAENLDHAQDVESLVSRIPSKELARELIRRAGKEQMPGNVFVGVQLGPDAL